MSNKDTMKLGFVGFIYTPPASIENPIERLKWHMSKTQELGGGVTQFILPYQWDQKILEDIKEHMEKTGNELELGAPLFGTLALKGSLLGDHKEEIRAIIDSQIQAAHFLGVKIMRGAYGKLKLSYTRYNKDYPLKEHIQFVVDNLKEAAKIFEDAGIYFALENHCDFNGKEFADIFSRVNSRHIGCLLDTANGFTVYCDPNEEIECLAEYAITTHIKDMLVEDFESPYGLIPFQARGCAVGDGNVNIPRAIDLLDQKSPFARGLHLIIEQGWMNYDKVTDREAYDKECVHKGLKYLQRVLGRNKDSIFQQGI
ncbi:MAG: sugar phosphate isomerase/epimerase [Spirochaetaceae bacterium]|jgi:sugar phosphate isomerase/epimerase|nr:sugar phosphate isomerase/epimerase [Spirochaetaceae bacterium]